MALSYFLIKINKNFANKLIPISCEPIEAYHTIDPVDDLSYLSFEEILQLNHEKQLNPEPIFFV